MNEKPMPYVKLSAHGAVSVVTLDRPERLNAIGAALLFPLAYQSSNLSVMVSNRPTIVVAVWLFFWIGLRGGRRQGSRIRPA